MYSVRYCTKCGTKLVENAKYCTNCGNQVLFAVKINVGGVEQDYQHVKSEEEAANKIIDDLGIDKSLFEYVKPRQEYSTIRYKGIDLFRIKYTDNTKWIQVPMTTQMRKANMDNPLFDIEKNKNKVFWKSNINNLLDYKDLLLQTIDFRENEAQKKELG